MSVVTQVILTFSILEDQQAVMADIDEFPCYSWRAVLVRPDREAADALSQPLFAASFNHLNIEAFKDHLAALPWEEPENVQLLLCQEEEARFTLYELLWDYAALPLGQQGRSGALWLGQSRRCWVSPHSC